MKRQDCDEGSQRECDFERPRGFGSVEEAECHEQVVGFCVEFRQTVSNWVVGFGWFGLLGVHARDCSLLLCAGERAGGARKLFGFVQGVEAADALRVAHDEPEEFCVGLIFTCRGVDRDGQSHGPPLLPLTKPIGEV